MTTGATSPILSAYGNEVRQTTETEMTGAEKIEKIMAEIEAGKTVQFRSGYSCINVSKKDVARFRKAGCEIFKAKGHSFYVARGRNWDCLDLHAVYVFA